MALVQPEVGTLRVFPFGLDLPFASGFRQPFNSNRTITLGVSPQRIAGGDFNGDGFWDVAVTNQGDSTVSLVAGDIDGPATVVSFAATCTSPGRHRS